MTIVRVWWTRVAGLAHASRPALSSADLAAVGRHRRAEDRERTSLGIVLARRAVAAELGSDADTVELVRVCGRCGGPHGKPRVDGAELSIAHSADVVAVAVCRTAAVGVDVELISRFTEDLRSVLGVGEAAAPGAPELATHWCRKESVVKATGDGLHVPLDEVVVTGPDDPAALLTYRSRRISAVLADLSFPEGYVAAATVLTEEPVLFEVAEARELLATTAR